MFIFSNNTVGKAPAEVILFPTGSLCVWHDIAVHDEHQLLLQGEEVWNHQLQVRLTASVKQHDGRGFVFLKILIRAPARRIHQHFSVIPLTGETRRRRGRKNKIGTDHPRNQLQSKGPTIPPRSCRKLNTLPLQTSRRACPRWTNGVPPFHATQDNVTLISLLKELSRGMSLHSHTTKPAGTTWSWSCLQRATSWTDVLLSPDSQSADVPKSVPDLRQDQFWKKKWLKEMCYASGTNREILFPPLYLHWANVKTL